jgi:hypothetical protein
MSRDDVVLAFVADVNVHASFPFLLTQ